MPSSTCTKINTSTTYTLILLQIIRHFGIWWLVDFLPPNHLRFEFEGRSQERIYISVITLVWMWIAYLKYDSDNISARFVHMILMKEA